MKKLSVVNKVIYFLNIVLAIVTFVAYALPFLAPKAFPFLAVLTLFLPMMLILNVIFFAFWCVQLKRQVVLSALVLLIGITFINKFYKFSRKEAVQSETDFKVMSYNVRLFNKFEWSEKTTIPVEISDFVNDKNPDILCIQEFSNAKEFNYGSYKHKFIVTRGVNIKTGQAIFSKYPIINTGEIIFANSSNNTIFADLIIRKDTVRVYSIHLQSIKISPDVRDISEDINEINQRKSEVMFKRISMAFKAQQLQASLIVNHKEQCKYPIILCGDMNNSAFSYVYRRVKGDLQDAFEVAGMGFGKSYDFNYYPARIDYIFADKKMKINYFQNFTEIKDSDHFPIMATMTLL